MKKLSVVIPVFNEAGNIGSLTRQVREVVGVEDELIVVDDGSIDNTINELDPNICRIVRHQVNRGKGEAIKSGIETASGEIIVFMDGDGQSSPRDIPVLLEAFYRGADFVIGSRFKGILKSGSITPLNYAGNKFVTILFNIVFGQKLTDSQASFKCVGATTLKALTLESDRYEIETEMLIRVIRKGYKVVEVPITHYPRGHGRSNLYGIPLGRLRFGLRFLKTVVKGYFFWK